MDLFAGCPVAAGCVRSLGLRAIRRSARLRLRAFGSLERRWSDLPSYL